MPGLTWKRMFATDGDPYAGIEWEKRDAIITNAAGKIIFIQKDVEVPKSWSQLALNVVAQKYLRGHLDKEGNPSPGRETSVRQLIDRVADTIAGWAGYDDVQFGGLTDEEIEKGWMLVRHRDLPQGASGHVAHCRPAKTMAEPDEVYFADKESWEAWRDDMKWSLVRQRFCFNSPVQFNVGIAEHPQCSACFIIRLEDYFTDEEGGDFDLDKHGLLAAQVKEGIIFSKGSGSGINLSRVRSAREWLSGGGKPSGPLSFARGLDSWATVVKSGGKTRRAAKMLITDVDHPDILDFINVKAREEKIAKALIACGWPADMDGEAYQHAFHQNSNLSARASDDFMRAVDERKPWDLISRSHHFLEDKPERVSMIGKNGRVLETVNAFDLMQEIGKSCWECGDPGMQFSDTINMWHTCADEEPIFASNPCSEYLFLDETACNLGSLNLRRFLKIEDDHYVFDTEAFVGTCRIFTVAMEVIVPNSKYPTKNFARMSNRYRTLGVGYANLGGMLMQLGISYDSDQAREIAAAVTSLMTAEVYATSAYMAENLGPFEAFEVNRGSCTRVMEQHCEANKRIEKATLPLGWGILVDQAARQWDAVAQACRAGKGIRNAQATVLAPTGTIAFMMDAETTGIEPELALVKFKVLAGGGTLEILNPLVAEILTNIGMGRAQVEQLEAHLKAGKSIRTFGENTGFALRPELLEVFRTSFPPKSEDSEFALPWDSHIKMMAAVQPFISGAISKTVNMPESSTVEDIIGAYTMAWHLGLKAVALYRDNCKAVQAISTSQKDDGSGTTQKEAAAASAAATIGAVPSIAEAVAAGRRKDLPTRVPSDRFKFNIDGNKGYLHVGYYPDTGKVAEIFVKMAKTGSTLNGLIDGFCRAFSVGLQYGAPLDDMATGYLECRFEPAGMVEHDSHVRSCRSILDYIAQKLLAVEEERQRGGATPVGIYEIPQTKTAEPQPKKQDRVVKTGLICRNCHGTNVVMKGRCKVCLTCGSEEGGCYA